ncbi:MAG: hypothetical protein GEU78_16920 [Actinobacteria bacterium]|nr:hypothetical protein [Actinomycetota bacterium]
MSWRAARTASATAWAWRTPVSISAPGSFAASSCEQTPSTLATRCPTGRPDCGLEGRYEIGPRALGHRSLLASPLLASSKQVLNTIKGREAYRPIAPCCRCEELDRLFVSPVEDPYMLYFSLIKTNALPAITHADGTARVQSVRAGDVPMLHRLLQAFGSQTGYGVLCNTSLNYHGRGFINSMSELLAYCEASEIREVVVEDRWYRRLWP